MATRWCNDVILLHTANESMAESKSSIGGEVSVKNWRNLSSLDVVWLQEVRCTTNHFNMKKCKKTITTKGDNTTNWFYHLKQQMSVTPVRKAEQLLGVLSQIFFIFRLEVFSTKWCWLKCDHRIFYQVSHISLWSHKLFIYSFVVVLPKTDQQTLYSKTIEVPL